MAKKIIIFIIILLLVGFVWYFTSSPAEEIEESDQPEEESEGESEAELEEADLMGILDRISNINSVKYDISFESPEETIEGSFWQKGQKIRLEGNIEGQNMIVIIDNADRSAYTYIPAEELAMKVNLGEVQEVQEGSMQDQSTDLRESNPVIVSEETLDGKECIVVEYGEPGQEGKMWIWKEHGMPIRVETKDTIIQAENIDFSEISDDKFTLPAGVEPMGVPSF